MYKISVIVPIYNAEQYICRCASSLFNQTLDSIEYIFVDDCSIDNSVKVLDETIRKYPSRESDVVIIKQPINQGPSSARNKGLEVAKGEYVIYCDADDWIDVDMYKVMYDKASSENLDMVWCDLKRHFKAHTTCIRTIPYEIDKIERLKQFISFGWSVCVNLLVKRTIYKDYKLRWYEGAFYNEDFDLAVRIFYYTSKVAKIEEAYYNYFAENQSSIVHWELDENKKHRIERGELIVCDRICNFFKEKHLWGVLEKELSWRILKAKRHLLLPLHNRNKYLELYPESNKYIDSNPFCSKKDKIYQKIILSSSFYWTLPILKRVELMINKFRLN